MGVESSQLDAPDGISVRIASDPRADEHERKRRLATEVVAERLRVDGAHVHVDREPPAQFGHRTRLFAKVRGEAVPLAISSASVGSSTVVAVADLVIPLGIDLRSARPDDGEWEEMRRHSHLFPGTAADALLAHWARVQAVRHADGRARIRPEDVVLDPMLDRGWIPDRRVHYRLADLSSDRWTVTLAYGALPA